MTNDAARVRAWWFHRQGMDGTPGGGCAREILFRSGWARSIAGVNPYLTLFSRGGVSRQQADDAAARLEIHELPAARGCTYVVRDELGDARSFSLDSPKSRIPRLATLRSMRAGNDHAKR